MFQVPPGNQSIGVHDQNAVFIPRQGELPDVMYLVSHRAIVRRDTTATTPTEQSGGDVTQTGKRQRPLVLADGGNGGGGPTGLS